MSKHIGKPLSAIVNNLDEPLPLWSSKSPSHPTHLLHLD
jgi:hypothetical protein